ncbi:hypothetical protein FE392_18000 [Xenorhabdus sp. 12]|uniref:Uncharacterized protein n=1 Tax=Xenorhabdus santafensis TaxID=2582833 RepID=A0ABU4SEH1_9GAMM|nr:hypothetical protein [Xenorhabdus sp. 12]MDX7989179.1 hypothetical protein [Xenorhabdus sp. 12]
MAKPHIHADLTMEYAKLAQETERPWEYFQYRTHGNEKWLDCNTLFAFHSAYQYRLKPRTIKIGNFDVPEPVREPLEEGAEYFYPYVSGTEESDMGGFFSRDYWAGWCVDMTRLKRGLIHLTPEAAELHAKSLISLTSK